MLPDNNKARRSTCYYTGMPSAAPPSLRSWRAFVAFFARRLPLQSPALCMTFSLLFLFTAFGLLPDAEREARAAPLIADALDGFDHGWRALQIVEGTMMAAACVGAWVFQARCLQICYPDFYDPYALDEGEPRRGPVSSGARGHGFVVGDMPVGLDEMRTSVLVTGVTGSSKTAGVLMPALAQLFATYNRETADELSTDEFQKIGAFIPEVKGDLVDGCIYLAHEAGRCVSRDVLILSPSCRIPVARYRDEEGRAWFLSARGGAGGSEAGDFLPRLRFPAGHPGAGRTVPASVFEDPADVAAVLPEAAAVRIPLGERQPRFVGWRWSGERLVRVSHTSGRDRTEPLLDPSGQTISVKPPRFLSLDGVVSVDNGLHYNLVDPRLPPSEAAERLTRLAGMSRGGSGRGDNEYFYDQGRKLIAACIALHRATAATPCTAGDIVRLATQDHRLGAALAALDARIGELEAEAAGADPEAREEARFRRIAPWRDLSLFFQEEWQKMVADGKTANIIKSTISGTFDAFLQDPNLAETFCQPSTFSFEDIVQSGKIIALVPGDRYEQLGRLLGTACKLDFQSTMLSRNGRADLNSSRLALYFADECHKYIISGSSTAGDPYFMNLSRSNNVVNICATQSYAWIVEVIGREAANVYISAFGVQFWLQQTDPETCRRAAEICGRITREKVSAEHDFNLGGLLGALRGGREMVVRHQVCEEERERHRAEDFSHLNVGEVIAYNKGRPGRLAKVVKGRTQYGFCTQRPEGTAAVSRRVREYYREIIENLTHERGQSSHWEASADAPSGPAGAPGESGAAAPAAEMPPALTLAQIERERADFTTHVGTLDAAIVEMTGNDPLRIALVPESAPGRPESPDPALAAALAGRERAQSESVAQAKRRAEAPRPAPDPGAFDAKILGEWPV